VGKSIKLALVSANVLLGALLFTQISQFVVHCVSGICIGLAGWIVLKERYSNAGEKISDSGEILKGNLVHVHSNSTLEKIRHYFVSFFAEFALFQTSMQKGTKKIEGEFLEISKTTAGIVTHANSISSSIASTRNNMQSVAAASEQLSANTANVAAAVEQMSASIAEVSSNASVAESISQKAKHIVTSTKPTVDNLAQSSQEIGKFVELISNIAGKTNLLAINATIEAATAGEHGRGFAVVASEVKALSQQTALAAKDVKKRIQDVQGSTDGVYVAFDEIAQVLGDITDRSAVINRSIDEQKLSASEISRNVSQTARATEEVNTNMQKVLSSISGISHEIGLVAEKNSQCHTSVEKSQASLQQLFVLESAIADLLKLIQIPDSEVIKRPEEEFLIWSDRLYLTGNKTIDDQHKELFSRLNTLFKHCLAGEGKEEVKPVLEFLETYVVDHFSCEEALMEKHKCSTCTKNKNAHKQFLGVFNKLKAKFEKDGPDTEFLLTLQKVVAGWLTAHIQGIDAKMQQSAQVKFTPQSDTSESLVFGAH